MNTPDGWLIGGATMLACGAWLLLASSRSKSVPGAGQSKPRSMKDIPRGCLPVLTGGDVVQQAGTSGLLASIRSKVGLAQCNYDRDYLPALFKYAEYVQLLPASESHHHAQPGGLLVHALEAVDIALTLRRGVVLPIGAHPEDLMHHEHRWTYGVFIATLLHDVGRPVSDLKVTAYGRSTSIGRPWTPLAGTLMEIAATHYGVAFTDPAERNYQAHTRLGVSMLNRIVPQTTMAWLAEDGALMEELTAYLFGETKGGALRDLSTRADGESVRRNLMMGPRTRFAASRAVPLIERMMEAMRRMLAEGGLLPLNRSGGAGWVYDGSIWFVSKRLADEVRKYLQANESASGIPGEDKNDRLFDVWQEYGALVSNPETNGAIWHARIEGDGYTHTFTLLRFQIHLLYQSPDRYPQTMVGRIVVLDKRTAKAPSSTAPSLAHQVDSGTQDRDSAAANVVVELFESADAPALSQAPPEAAETVVVAKPRMQSGGDILDRLAALGGKPVAQDDGYLDDVHVGADVDIDVDADDDKQEPAAAALSVLEEQQAKPGRPRTDARSVATATRVPRIPMPVPKSVPMAAPTKVLAPVVPHTPAPPKLPGTPQQGALTTPPVNAQRLMAWIQTGIATGDLVYNVTGALIHFVEEDSSTVMLLVSPRIFRHYLESIGECNTGEPEDKLGSILQKEFFKAGWHRLGPKKTNILRYRVQRRKNSGEGSLLSVVVIPSPERFVNPVPPPNPYITKHHD